MELHKVYINKYTLCYKRGFTLVEVLVVLSLIAIVASCTLFFDSNTYRTNAFHVERNNLIVALQTARADALHNIHQVKHGVAIHPAGYTGYVIFEGTSFAASDPATQIQIPTLYPVTLNPPSPSEVVFSQLSGDAGYNGEIVLRDGQRNATSGIVINYEGKIGW